MSVCQVTVRVIAHPDPEEALRVVARAFLSDWERTKTCDASRMPRTPSDVSSQESQAQVS